MIPKPVELHLYRQLQLREGQHFLLGISGGLDSVVLLHAFSELAKKLSITFSVAHIHHGPGEKEQVKYRERAQSFVKELCEHYGATFLTSDNMPKEELKSEEQLRNFRRRELSHLMYENEANFIVLAHHRDDLLETRLIRLIRGTGATGFRAMQVEQDHWLRPMLSLSRSQIHGYAQERELRWLEDPSNENTQSLRNWLRKEWLPALENYRPGAIESVNRSFESIAESLSVESNYEHCYDDKGLLRSEFISLSSGEKKQVVAKFLRSRGLQDYSLSHVNELIKRLDVEKKDLTFRLLKRNWRANARHIWCE